MKTDICVLCAFPIDKASSTEIRIDYALQAMAYQ
ncbi:hypothetical protein T4D_15759 [Trichinella pseudospiralis]|uniref:Uncharacterized protein n=1 Tax=Trichinella pseudospiralis TaxID=6337 RepID=A0A0V1C592_TRIPS|nr:hypothetical protein T4D_15759 [Trichinella pseudospiralis]